MLEVTQLIQTRSPALPNTQGPLRLWKRLKGPRWRQVSCHLGGGSRVTEEWLCISQRPPRSWRGHWSPAGPSKDKRQLKVTHPAPTCPGPLLRLRGPSASSEVNESLKPRFPGGKQKPRRLWTQSCSLHRVTGGLASPHLHCAPFLPCLPELVWVYRGREQEC